jgi:hypothetical protein
MWHMDPVPCRWLDLTCGPTGACRWNKKRESGERTEEEVAENLAKFDAALAVHQAARAVPAAAVKAYAERIQELKKDSVALVIRELCVPDMADCQEVHDQAVQEALLHAIRAHMDDDTLQLILEHEHIGVHSWEKISQIFHDAVCAALKQKPGTCPRIAPKAEILQAKMNQLNQAMLGCNPHHPERNPGCLLDLHPVLSHLCKNTQAKTSLLYVCLRVDANLSRLYLSATNHTDHVLTADNPHPQLNQYQDPTSPNTMDFGVIKPAPHLKKNDDVEDPLVSSDLLTPLLAWLHAATR